MASGSRRRVLLVGWDAADWKIIQPMLDRGELPVLEQLVTGGVSGNLSSIRPMLSPMLWNSIATGKRPFKHGVHGFTEVDPLHNQVVPVSSSTRQCKAIWNILNQAGLKTHVVGWFATHPAEPVLGACVTDRFAAPAPPPGHDWPLPAGAIFPHELTGTLAALRMRPEEIPGEILPLFVPDAAAVNQEHDKRLHQIAIDLAEAFSVHAAATYLLEHEPWDFAAVYYRAIDWLCHHFMQFHPPLMPGVYQPEFELYRGVVEGAYRLHDLMLGRLLQLAGEGTTVMLVSDHGFKSGHRRPPSTPDVPAGIAVWHRLNGILALRGAGLREDELVHGANLLDITPTILALFGLPIASDMDGRVLLEAFAEQPTIERIESWENVDEGVVASASPLKPTLEAQKELLRQFIDIGYIDSPGDNPEEAIRSTRRENDWALAQSYLDAGKFADALPLLETVFEEWPERPDYCTELALCQLNLGMAEEAQETLGSLAGDARNAGTLILHANIEHRRGNFAAALDFLARAEALDPVAPGLQNQVALTRLRLHQPALAEVAFRKAIALDGDDPHAHLGLAFCRLRARQFEEAAEAALRALGLKFDLFLGHYHLGVALARLDEFDRAIQAFETCLHYQPAWLPAHRFLAYLYRRRRNEESQAKAEQHRTWLRGRVARLAAWREYQSRLRREAVARAGTRAAHRRETRARAAAVPAKSTPVRRAPESLEFLLVSGLPRSGTSLMMQILEAGGLPIMRDDLRPADESNPRGYYEWQAIKQLPRNPFIIEQAHGKVTKVISMLLPWLPRRHQFRVIFMKRPVDEVARSQEQLRSRLASRAADQDQMTRSLDDHLRRTLTLLRGSSNVALLEVEYAELLDHPTPSLARIAEFARIHGDRLPRMAAVIDPALCHFSTTGV